MSEKTTNYGFQKPAGSEYYLIDEYNALLDELDGLLKEISDVATAAANKTITIDSIPKSGSTNPVSSGGVYSAISETNKILSSHTHKKADITDMPTKLSDFTNDQSFKGIAGVSVSLAAGSWSDAKTQTVSASGVTASSIVDVGPDPDSTDIWGNFGVLCTSQGAGSLTFTCKAIPTSDITVYVKTYK